MSENKALNVKQLDVGLTPNIGFFLNPSERWDCVSLLLRRDT